MELQKWKKLPACVNDKQAVASDLKLRPPLPLWWHSSLALEIGYRTCNLFPREWGVSNCSIIFASEHLLRAAASAVEGSPAAPAGSLLRRGREADSSALQLRCGASPPGSRPFQHMLSAGLPGSREIPLFQEPLAPRCLPAGAGLFQESSLQVPRHRSWGGLSRRGCDQGGA